MKNCDAQLGPTLIGILITAAMTAACSGKPSHSESADDASSDTDGTNGTADTSDDLSSETTTDSRVEEDTGADAVPDEKRGNRMNIEIGERVLTATLADNTSVTALKAALAKGPITIEMRDYANMEKVGPLGMDLPRNDESINADAGDIILYQGNALVIYYAPNSWRFTRLGRIDDISSQELKEILGDGAVTVTLSLP